MLKRLGHIFLYIVIGQVVSFRSPFNLWRSTKLNCKGLDDDNSEFKYAKEYYNFLVNYDILNDKKIYSESSLFKSGYDDDFYLNIIKERIDNYKIFENNYEKIKKFNKQGESFKLGLNQFADSYDLESNNYLMKNEINTLDIIKNDFTGIKQIFEDPLYYIDKYSNINSELIWTKPIVSDVKDQGRCGSCWAFSSTNAIEANMRLNNYTIDRLSEQELVDCSNKNYGCNGGLMHLAFDYVIDNDGLTSNELYNYTAKTGQCSLKCNNCTNLNITKLKVNGSNINDYKFTIPRSVMDLKASLKRGPVSIALDASPFEFRFYKDGVIDIPSKNTSRINHAVLLTGYSENENGTYWIIQNSWGERWGDNGYAKIKVKSGDGVLLSQLYGVYPYN